MFPVVVESPSVVQHCCSPLLIVQRRPAFSDRLLSVQLSADDLLYDNLISANKMRGGLQLSHFRHDTTIVRFSGRVSRIKSTAYLGTEVTSLLIIFQEGHWKAMF